MDVINENSPAPSLRRLPFSIRLAPEFVNYLFAILPEDDDGSDPIDGLLFGIVESDFVVLRVFRLFAGNVATAGQESFEAFLAQSKKDPQSAGLALLGWFSTRSASGLQAEDIAFHRRNFAKSKDVALILKYEPAGELSFEIYCAGSDGSFSDEKHRRGSIRISNRTPVHSPVEIPLETKLETRTEAGIDRNVLYPRLQPDGAIEVDDPAARWKDALASTKKAFDFLKPAKPEEKNESATSNLDSEEIDLDDVDILRSIAPGWQFGTRGGAAPAPARIPEERPETHRAAQPGRENVPLDPDRPRIVIGPRQTPPPINSGDAVLVRPEKQPPVPPSDPPIAKTAPESPQAQPFDAKPNPVQDASAELRSAFSKQLAVRPKKSARDLPWRVMAAVFAVAVAGTFGLIYFKGAHAKGTLPGFLQVLLPTPGLNLKVSTSGERFQLSWNRDTPAARSAREAILDINDGPNHHQIRLGGPEVANGSVLYLPNSDDVVFRLEVHGAGGQNASESLRVVGTVKSASLDVSRPVETEETKNSSPARNVAGPGAQTSKNAVSGARTQAALPKRERSQKDLVAPKPVPSRAGTNPTVSSSADSAARVGAVSPPPAAKLEKPRESAAPSNSASQNANGTDAVAENQRPTVPSAREAAESSPTNAAGPSGQPHSSDAAKPSEPPNESAPPRTTPLGNAPAQIPGPAQTPSGQPVPRSTEPLQTYRPPRPVKQVLPKVSALPPGVVDAVGEVRVLVKVDQSGHVIDARLVQGQKKIGSMLGTASLAAARQWVFEPASLRGQSIASDHTILFQFRH